MKDEDWLQRNAAWVGSASLGTGLFALMFGIALGVSVDPAWYWLAVLGVVLEGVLWLALTADFDHERYRAIKKRLYFDPRR